MANKQLQTEKEQLTSNVETLSKNLETTVATASVLKAEYIKVTSYKRKGQRQIRRYPAREAYAQDGRLFRRAGQQDREAGRQDRLPEDHRTGW